MDYPKFLLYQPEGKNPLVYKGLISLDSIDWLHQMPVDQDPHCLVFTKEDIIFGSGELLVYQ